MIWRFIFTEFKSPKTCEVVIMVIYEYVVYLYWKGIWKWKEESFSSKLLTWQFYSGNILCINIGFMYSKYLYVIWSQNDICDGVLYVWNMLFLFIFSFPFQKFRVLWYYKIHICIEERHWTQKMFIFLLNVFFPNAYHSLTSLYITFMLEWFYELFLVWIKKLYIRHFNFYWFFELHIDLDGLDYIQFINF